MADDDEMRFRLQQVVAYRALCRSIQRSGRENVFFALMMLGLAYFLHMNGPGGWGWTLILYGVLAAAEISVGLFKWVFPSAECILLDGLVLVLFAGWNLGSQLLMLAMGRQPQWAMAFVGVYILFAAFRRFQFYIQLRRLFAERPTSSQIAWFNELIYEIRNADPEMDDLAIDLPTRPYMRAKLLGTTAFFVPSRTDTIVIAGPQDFWLIPQQTDPESEHLHVVLVLHQTKYPPFVIDQASWKNYSKWIAANPYPEG